MAPCRVLALTSLAAAAPSWEEWKATHSRVYESTEEDLRRSNFERNSELVQAENAKGHTYTLELNRFADLSREEYRQQLGYKGGKRWSQLPASGTHTASGLALPDSVDWTQKGAVTPVKDQGQCGSCWAFSATGALEGAWQLASGTLASLSEQQLVDCSSSNEGCNGGDMDQAFKYLGSVNVCTEDSYAYQAVDGSCASSTCEVALPRGAVTGYKDVKGEDGLASAVAQQPVSVAIEADQVAFQFYKSGVLDGSCGTDLDHGVLVVGYGSDAGKAYWKVKNSWGASWGEQGYLRIARGKNQCGIASEPSYPTVDSSVPPSPPAPTPPPPPPTTTTTTSQPPVSPTCPFPPVQDCYVRSLKECWTPMLEKDAATKAALEKAPDASVASGIEKLLTEGESFKKVWNVTVDKAADEVHLTAYKFEADGFLQDETFAEATLQLNAGTDAAYNAAYQAFVDEFEGHFFQHCVSGHPSNSLLV